METSLAYISLRGNVEDICCRRRDTLLPLLELSFHSHRRSSKVTDQRRFPDQRRKLSTVFELRLELYLELSW